MKPRFRAEAVGGREMPLLRWSVGFWILFNWDCRPSNRNSVFELLRQRRLEVIQLVIVLRAVCRLDMFSLNRSGWKDINNWVSSAYKWWLRVVINRRRATGPSCKLGYARTRPRVTLCVKCTVFEIWWHIGRKSPSFGTCVWCDPLRIFRRLIYCQKLESWGYRMVYISRSCFRSARHNTGVWQTDGRTDRRTSGYVAVAKTALA